MSEEKAGRKAARTEIKEAYDLIVKQMTRREEKRRAAEKEALDPSQVGPTGGPWDPTGGPWGPTRGHGTPPD